jgi:PAS domain S-box-containing protein
MTDTVYAGMFEAWLASTDDGAIGIDATGRVLLHNPAASRVTGLAPAEGRSLPWREVLRLEPAVADLLWSVRSTGRPVRTLADVLCAQGNLRIAEVSARPWTDADGAVGVLVLIRDAGVLCRQGTGPGGRPGYGSLVGSDPAMAAMYQLIDAVAPSDASVLIEGESGVGKEIVAQLLHARSPRAERPLIAVDCAAVAPDALEVELFGEVRGTAPSSGTRIGRIELAHSGTLGLESVNRIPLPVQARLLHLLQAGEIERRGDSRPRAVDVRVIAASTAPLEQEVALGRFRQDLYRRLRVVRIAIPALRDRRRDIPLLADHFLSRYAPPGTTLTEQALAALQASDWPGNVRQLEGVLREASTRISYSSPDMTPTIELGHLAVDTLRQGAKISHPIHTPAREDRRTALLRALSSHGGNRTAAARALGIGRATFYRWWREAGLGSAGPDLS